MYINTFFRFFCLTSSVKGTCDIYDESLKESNSQIHCAHCSLLKIPERINESSSGLQINALHLPYNQISVLNIDVCSDFYPRLYSLDLQFNNIRSIFKSGSSSLLSLKILNLSGNNIHMLHNYVLTGFPSLKCLNVSHNYIHTISESALSLPKLQTLDLSYNKLSSLEEHFFETSPLLNEILVSHNSLSRLNNGLFGLLVHLEMLDLSHNFLMKIEDNVFVGMNITHLNFAYNNFRKVPSLSLKKLSEAQTLNFDGNVFTVLQERAFENIRVEILSLSFNSLLFKLESQVFNSLFILKTLTINNNPNLVYIDSAAIVKCPVLAALDLRKNNLTSLEEEILENSPKLNTLYLSENPFKCHCSLSWLSNLNKSNIQLMDENLVTCLSKEFQTSILSHYSYKECEPYILPLYKNEEFGHLGGNVSWMCRALGSTNMSIYWKLPNDLILRSGSSCQTRICVYENKLSIHYLHPSDSGVYTCTANNTFGQDQKNIQFAVKSENIQIFPITIASTFVTLSWNTSSHLSNGYILQVEKYIDNNSYNTSFLRQYKDIDVGLKMNSYTVNGLTPGEPYKFELCLRKSKYIISISSTILRTKNSGYEVSLGIKTDYVSILGVVLVLTSFISLCVLLNGRQLWSYKMSKERDENLSTRKMIESPSELSSAHDESNLLHIEKSK